MLPLEKVQELIIGPIKKSFNNKNSATKNKISSHFNLKKGISENRS